MSRPRIYPVGVAHDGAPIFTMRLAPELLEWVRDQGGSHYLRQLILADRQRQQNEPLEPESPGPVILSYPRRTWWIGPAPREERLRHGKEPGHLWALVHRTTGRLIGLLPLDLAQVKHLHHILAFRFDELPENGLDQNQAWQDFLARLKSLGILLRAQATLMALPEEPPTEPSGPDPNAPARTWVNKGWGVESPGLLVLLLKQTTQDVWAIGHVPSQHVLGLFYGSFEAAVRVAQQLADRFPDEEGLTWRQLLRRRPGLQTAVSDLCQTVLKPEPRPSRAARR